MKCSKVTFGLLLVFVGLAAITSADSDAPREKRTVHHFLKYFFQAFNSNPQPRKAAVTQPPPPPPPPPTTPAPKPTIIVPQQSLDPFGFAKFNIFGTPFKNFGFAPQAPVAPPMPAAPPAQLPIPDASKPVPTTALPPPPTPATPTYVKIGFSTLPPLTTDLPSTTPTATEPQSTLPPPVDTTLVPDTTIQPNTDAAEPKQDTNVPSTADAGVQPSGSINPIQNPAYNAFAGFPQYWINPMLAFQQNGGRPLSNPSSASGLSNDFFGNALDTSSGGGEFRASTYLPPTFIQQAPSAPLPSPFGFGAVGSAHSSVKMHDSDFNFFTYHSGESGQVATMPQAHVQFFGK